MTPTVSRTPEYGDKVADGVDQEIDGILGQRFNVPFPEPVPKIIRTAALFLTLEAL